MFWKKLINREVETQGEAVLKMASMQTIFMATIAAQIAVLVLSAKADLFPGTDALMSIITTCSQIIAGLYGITLAGYTFFLSRIDALSVSDATLDYVVRSIKNRFKYLILYITFCVLMALMFSIGLMYCPVPEETGYGYRLICNEFVSFSAFSIVLILYYSILVVDPNCIEKETAILKRKFGGRFSAPGSAVEFIALYDHIEQQCSSLLPEGVLNQLHENKGKHFELTLQLLEEQHLLVKPLLQDINRIHRYYECVINSKPLSVSQDMCQLARKVSVFLDQTGTN